MEAHTSTLPSVYLLTDSLICPHNALVSYMKLVPRREELFVASLTVDQFVSAISPS